MCANFFRNMQIMRIYYVCANILLRRWRGNYMLKHKFRAFLCQKKNFILKIEVHFFTHAVFPIIDILVFTGLMFRYIFWDIFAFFITAFTTWIEKICIGRMQIYPVLLAETEIQKSKHTMRDERICILPTACLTCLFIKMCYLMI